MDKVVADYRKIVLERMRALCWIFLLIVFAVKIFGGNFFAFVGSSKVAEYIEQHFILLLLMQFCFYFIGTYFFFLTVYTDKYKKLCAILTVALFGFKQLIDFGQIFVVIAFVLEIFCMFVLPIILKQKILKVLILNILLVVYMFISSFVKDINLLQFPYEELVGYIYLIDYYIMIILTYLDYKINGGNKMKIGLLWLSKDKTQLEAYKKHVIEKHNRKLAKIDARIAKAE